MRVSELNKDIIWFIYFMGNFQFVLFFNALLKLLYFLVLNKKDTNFNKSDWKLFSLKNFWNYFLLDYLSYPLPLLFYQIYFYECTFSMYILLVALSALLCYISFVKVANKSYPLLDEKNGTTDKVTDLETKLIQLSVNGFRAAVFILVVLNILAVDFNFFPSFFHKTSKYGIGLMDVGVGYFILCHAMRYIRNASSDSDVKSIRKNLEKYPSVLYFTIKRTYVLIALGLFRLITVKLLDYGYNHNEYGIHWNFFFTIAAVKIMSTPFEVVICERPVRGFIISFTVAAIYQMCLSGFNFSEYLLQIDAPRGNFFDANREGLSSIFGYVSIYLAGQATCIYLKTTLIKRNYGDKSIAESINTINSMLKYLFSFTFILLIALFITSNYIEEPSRRICNLSFILFTVMSGTFFWMVTLLAILILTIISFHFIQRCADRKVPTEKKVLVNLFYFLENAFSFVEIIDSKLIGLLIFVLANWLTGLVNITLHPHSQSDIVGYIILSVYTLLSLIIPFMFYFYNAQKNARSAQRIPI